MTSSHLGESMRNATQIQCQNTVTSLVEPAVNGGDHHQAAYEYGCTCSDFAHLPKLCVGFVALKEPAQAIHSERTK